MGLMRRTAKRLCWWARIRRTAQAPSSGPHAPGPLEQHLRACALLSTHVAALRERLAGLRRDVEAAQRGLEDVDRLYAEHHLTMTQHVADELARYYVELESHRRVG